MNKYLFLVLLFLISISTVFAEIKPDKKFIELMQSGINMHDSGKYKESIELYKMALNIDANPWTWYEIGYSYLKMGKDNNAASSFNKAIKIDPTYFKAYIQLGYLFSRNGQPDMGNKLYFKAYIIEPKRAVGSLNNIAINLGRHGTARVIEFYRLILSQYPRNKLLLYNLSQIYNEGDFEYLTSEEIDKRNFLNTAMLNFNKLKNRKTFFYNKELDYYIALINFIRGNMKAGKKHIEMCAKSSNIKVKSKCQIIIKNDFILQNISREKLFAEEVGNFLSIDNKN